MQTNYRLIGPKEMHKLYFLLRIIQGIWCDQTYLKPEKEIYTEEINPTISYVFSKMVDDEIRLMGFDPVIKRKEWDKETEKTFTPFK